MGWLPGHHYSPYPELGELGHRYSDLADRARTDLPAIDLRTDAQLRHLEDLCATATPTLAELGFPSDNDAYRAGDALVLLRQLQHRPPKRVIEVGSGYSTALLQAIRRQEVIPRFDHIVIDPYPERVFELLGSDVDGLELRDVPLQSVEPELVRSLADGDVFFVDSSHVSKPGSDVNAIVFEWLPLLAPGVRAHFHDIHFPFEYRWEWIRQGRAWSEAFLLRAFLQFNSHFVIALFTDQLTAQEPELMARLGHEFEPSGSSLWIERIPPAVG